MAEAEDEAVATVAEAEDVEDATAAVADATAVEDTVDATAADATAAIEEGVVTAKTSTHASDHDARAVRSVEKRALL